MFPSKRKQGGFTLIELVVAMAISSVLVVMTVATYTVFRKSIVTDQAKADLSQNARVAMDRISRDLRQTHFIVTTLPVDSSGTQPGEIEFENDHALVGDSDYMSYHRYFIDSTGTLQLQTKYYILNGNKVTYSAGGTATIDSTVPIANDMSSLAFYSADGSTIQIVVTTTDGVHQTYQLRTTVRKRN